MQRSGIRGWWFWHPAVPDSAALHPGYEGYKGYMSYLSASWACTEAKLRGQGLSRCTRAGRPAMAALAAVLLG
jgi:hypothetical protein